MDEHQLVAPVSRVELREAVEAQLRELILSGRFSAGQRLIESDLAARFGTSRGPVRDALASLEASGLVTTAARSGTFVADLSSDDIEELYSLRMALEELAVQRAVSRVSRAELSQMSQALDDLSRAVEANDSRAIGEADIRFHRAIIEAADHRRLREAWENLADQSLLLMRELPSLSPQIQADFGHHRMVLEAIAHRDAIAAAAAMKTHLMSARDAMITEQVAE